MAYDSLSAAQVLSTNIASVIPDPGGSDRNTGIQKVPVDALQVSAPGPNYGDRGSTRGSLPPSPSS